MQHPTAVIFWCLKPGYQVPDEFSYIKLLLTFANICLISRLQRNSFSSSKMSWRYHKDILKMSWRYLAKCLGDILQDVLKTAWRRLQHVLEDEKLLTSWRRWKQKKCLLVISVRNKSKFYLTNLYFTNLNLTNPKCIN